MFHIARFERVAPLLRGRNELDVANPPADPIELPVVVKPAVPLGISSSASLTGIEAERPSGLLLELML